MNNIEKLTQLVIAMSEMQQTQNDCLKLIRENQDAMLNMIQDLQREKQ